MSKLGFVLVDDEKAIVDNLKTELRRAFGPSYLYEGAQSADEAWSVISDLIDEEVKIVVVVSDWLMPEVKGDEFLGKLKDEFPNTFRIMLTGYATNDAIRHLQKNQIAQAIITKPWSSAELEDTIRAGIAE